MSERTNTVDEIFEFEMAPGGGFTHPEMLEIVGLSAERYFGWHKHGWIPAELIPKSGRGNRRRYHVTQLAVLAAARALADAGLPNRDAFALGHRLGLRVLGVFDGLELNDPAAAIEKARNYAHPHYAVYAVDERNEPKFDPLVTVAGPYAFVPIFASEWPKITDWMRSNRLVTVTIMDIAELAVGILEAALKVKAARIKKGS